jgi:hypothetical protein
MDPLKQQGYVTESDKRVAVTVRDWNAMRLAVWRSRVAWDIVAREALALVARAAHMTGCPAETSETETCLADCPDRELRLSALVILSAARQFAPVQASRIAEGPFIAPSRERYSEVIAELVAAQSQLEAIRKTTPLPEPPPLPAAQETPQ